MRALHIRIFIFVSLCFALFLFAPKVDALSLDGDIVGETQVFNNNVYTSISADSSNSPKSVSKIFDINYSNSSNHNYLVFPLVGVMLQRYYQNGVIVDSSIGEQDFFSNLILNQFISVKLIPTAGTWVSCEIQNNLLVCPMLPNVTYKGLEFILSNPYLNSQDTFFFTLTLNRYAWIYDKDKSISNSIQNQTDEIQNSDAPASASYNNDYSTNSFDAASNSVNQHTDINVSSLNLNTSGYSSSWSWLWSLSESFIANVKVFGAYIFMLTLGFIALVLGR